MIVEERMRTFINSLDAGNTPFLDELECSALSEGVPIIRKEMQSFIKTLLALKKPQRILEVGTAVGFSTLLMCEYSQPEMHITTIENYEKRIPKARENFRRAGRESQITFLEGDAGQILKELSGSYDLIFMDIQMPVKDGLEATMEIRKMERQDLSDITIIAVTAHAFRKDRLRTLEAGVDYHLTLPLNQMELTEILARELLENDLQKESEVRGFRIVK